MICGQTSSLFERASALGQVFTDRTTRLPCFELSDHGAQMKLSAAELKEVSGAKLMLPQVLSHPALYTAYPWLADIQVKVDPSLSKMDAATDGHGYIRIPPETQPPMILHEVQHLVQRAEGFAPGENPKAIGHQLLQLRADTEIQEHAKAMFELLLQANKPSDVSRCVELQLHYAASKGLSQEQAQAVMEQAVAFNKAAHRSYFLSPGELMALETQARTSLSPQQRQMLQPMSALGSPYVLPKPLALTPPAGAPQPQRSRLGSLAPTDFCAPEKALPELGEKSPAVVRSERFLPYNAQFRQQLRIVRNPLVAHAQQRLIF